jgi:PAS domain S-box-containing protein
MLAVAILVRDTRRRASRLAVALAVCGAWWAGCELFWNTTTDAQAALFIVRLAAPGWLIIGPVVLHLFLELTAHPARHHHGPLALLYAAAATLSILDFTTSLLHTGVQPTSWGWGFEVGPLFVVGLLFASTSLFTGLVIGFREFRRRGSAAERRQLNFVLVGLAAPLLISTMTDGVLPLLGYQLPRFGSASLTLVAGTLMITSQRFGFSLLAPGAFAYEILATLRDGVALVRSDGEIHSVNRAISRMVGASPLSLEGTQLASLITPSADGAIDPAAEVSELECRLWPEVGDPIAVSVTTSILRDKRENPIGQVLVVRDLREIVSLRSRLITSGRLASVGQLAAGIAHEINNPIAFVRANLSALGELLQTIDEKLAHAGREVAQAALAEDLADGHELVSDSLEGVDRVAAIVRDVKGFSHAGSQDWQLVELNPLLDSVLRVAAPELRYVQEVERDYHEIPPVYGAPQELKQVFLNLVINASQAVDGDEAIRIRTRAEGEHVTVEIADEGCGIPKQVIERIYDPFFTTKPVGEGIGLGLSISYEIVRTHHGELSVDSEVGVGTRCRVVLPIAETAPGSDT